MKTKKKRNDLNGCAELEMACRIANEFQTPLGVIISAGELLESYFERLTPERRRLALEDIIDTARQMNHSIDLLSASYQKSSQSSNKHLRVQE
jgi:signal transduction histidine kinase